MYVYLSGYGTREIAMILSLVIPMAILQSLVEKTLALRLRIIRKGHQQSNRKEHQQSNRNWEHLSEHLLEEIVSKLNLRDSIGMSMACKSWRSAIMDFKTRNNIHKVTVPWLMLPYQRKTFPNTLRFFDLCDGIIYNIKLPSVLQGASCCGSSKGWLLMLKGPLRKPQVFLFNPISSVHLELPSLTTVSSYQKTFLKDAYDTDNLILRFDLSSSSIEATDCIVAVNFDRCRTLALCRPKDKRWTSWAISEGGADDVFFLDILFSNGILHGLIWTESDAVETHTLSVWDEDEDDHTVIDLKLQQFHFPNLDAFPEFQEIETEFGWILKGIGFMPYLVESKRELLLVHKMTDDTYTEISTPDDPDDDDDVQTLKYSQACGFQVFKIGHPSTTSVTVTRLNSLDDQTLFLTKKGSLCIPGRDLKGLEENCIFFLDEDEQDDDYLEENCEAPASRESGIFYFKDGKIKRCFPSLENTKDYLMIWFLPNL